MNSVKSTMYNLFFCNKSSISLCNPLIFSIFTSIKSDMNPRDYLNDIIARMPYHKKAAHEELIKLLPHQWKLQHQENVLTKQAAESGN